MWMPRSLPEKRVGGNGLIAVAIDKDKSSQIALKWAIDNLLVKGQTVILIHVNLKSSLSSHSSSPSKRLPCNHSPAYILQMQMENCRGFHFVIVNSLIS
jgi:hypothetical protein